MRLALSSRKEDAHDDAVWSATWNNNNNSIISGSVDESVKNWSIGQDDSPALDNLHTWTGGVLLSATHRSASTQRIIYVLLSSLPGLVLSGRATQAHPVLDYAGH